MPDGRPPDRSPAVGARRIALVVLGWLALGLGLVGAFLPLLPTTPFLLLAAACFARSSPRLHRRLLESERLGPYLRQWQEDRSVPRGAKRRAYLLVVATFTVSILIVDARWQRLLLVGIGVALLLFLFLLRTGELEERLPEGTQLGPETEPSPPPSARSRDRR